MKNTDDEKGYKHSLSHLSLFVLEGYLIVEISGVDAERYLHGRLTQSVKSLSPGAGAKSLLLSPQGKIQSQLLLLKKEETYLLLFDPSEKEDSKKESLQALFQFRVADQVFETDHTSTHALISLQGPKATPFLNSLKIPLPENRFSHLSTEFLGSPITIIKHQRGAPDGFDLLVPKDKLTTIETALLEKGISFSLQKGSAQAFEILRIAAGISLFGSDLSHQVIAPDIPLGELVSFQKGCYTGQEVVEMATARGRPNKKFLLFGADASFEVLPGASIFKQGESALLPVGTVTSSATLRSSTLVLGFVKFSVDENEPFIINNQTFLVRTTEKYI